MGRKRNAQPKNGKQLRDYLQTNKSFIFTLIHKFRYDKGKKYPVLSTRDDIIVLVDEAHPDTVQGSGGEHAHGLAKCQLYRLYWHPAAGQQALDQPVVRELCVRV